MKTLLCAVSFVIALVLALRADVHAQEQGPVAPGPAAAQVARERDLSVLPLNIRIVISKYQGERRISSSPYELPVRSDARNAQLRMVTQVPMPNMTPPKAPEPGNPSPPPPAFSYRDVGTTIDCVATRADTERFAIRISVEDTSVLTEEARIQNGPMARGVPAFRSFRVINATAVLKDGQSTQFIAATDKINGEVTKVEVSLMVVK